MDQDDKRRAVLMALALQRLARAHEELGRAIVDVEKALL